MESYLKSAKPAKDTTTVTSIFARVSDVKIEDPRIPAAKKPAPGENNDSMDLPVPKFASSSNTQAPASSATAQPEPQTTQSNTDPADNVDKPATT